MSRYHSYLNSAKTILQHYKGGEPFGSFLKKFFAAEKKYGSKDRRAIGHLCYCYFRLGKAATGLTIDERILLGLFLCSDAPNEILNALKPEWNEKTNLSLQEKMSSASIRWSSVFPWEDELSETIDYNKFCESFFTQPHLFLRIRPGLKQTVFEKLRAGNITYSMINDDCIILPNGTKIEELVELNKEAVVQDYSSQRIAEFLKLTIDTIQSPISVWDCCAASGGKSILAKDVLGHIDLTVSDVRESILINLRARFKQAGITNYKSNVIDLAKANFQQPIINNQQSIIITDVPCTGSGTWARTPEQLAFFNNQTIEQYSNLQKKIISNVAKHLRPGGYFLYITCSVFKKENEANAEFIKQQFHLDLIKMELLKGYDKKADTMFAALFKRSL